MTTTQKSFGAGHSISETARVLNVSRSTVDLLVGRGNLAGVRIGRRVLVPTVELEEFSARRRVASQLAEFTPTVHPRRYA